MAFQVGTQIKPELADADYSGFVNAANIQAQAMMNLGEQIGGGIEKYQQNKQITAAGLAELEGIVAANPNAYAAVQNAGGEAAKSIKALEEGNYKQRDVLTALGAVQAYEGEQQKQQQARMAAIEEQQLMRVQNNQELLDSAIAVNTDTEGKVDYENVEKSYFQLGGMPGPTLNQFLEFAEKPEGGLTFEQKLAQNKFDFEVDKFNYEQALEEENAAMAARQSQDAAKFSARDLLRQNQNVMRKAQRAGTNIGFGTTGLSGALFGMIPGTKGFDQKATVETLQADAAFSALQRMRDASKTGGALGQVSERELDLLMSSVGNLTIGQSEEQFRNNLVEYINLRNEAMLNIYDAFEADYGTSAANEAFKVRGRNDLVSPGGGGTKSSTTTQTNSPSGRYSVEVL